MRRSIIVVAMTLLTLGGVATLGGCEAWNNMWNKDKDKDAAKMERTSMTALPAPVRDTFNRDSPNANVSSINRETEKDGAVHYEFKFTDQSGRKQEVEYDGNGNRAHE
jgi:hypothetical protein